MANFLPEPEVVEAQREFGFFAVQPVRSQGVFHPQTGHLLVPAGEIEAVVFSLINLLICGTQTLVTLQFRLVPAGYPEVLPAFYLVSPRSFALVPEIYKQTRPRPTITEAREPAGEDPRSLGWAIGQGFPRVRFEPLEELWVGSPEGERRLRWGLVELRDLLMNPLHLPVPYARAG